MSGLDYQKKEIALKEEVCLQNGRNQMQPLNSVAVRASVDQQRKIFCY